MGFTDFIVGIGLGVLIIAVGLSLDSVFTNVPDNILDLYKFGFYFMGLIVIFIGLIEK